MLTEIDALVEKLQHAASLGPKPLVRATQYTYPQSNNDRAHELFSWKTLESAYRDFGKESLPTLARGLFIEQGSDDHWRIAARGYDKFFNIDELPWTRPQAISAYSKGPYVLSYKENGCIIFIAAVAPNRLIVTSKHALGATEPDQVGHADMGRRWLDRHLASANKSEEDLAADLWQRNQTAVLELCDDSFEEHVLPYPPERTGLHLHGLNDNAEAFRTADMEEVVEFAARYGFLPVRYRKMDTLAEVEAFAAEVGKTGSLDGEPIEGFVVRTRMPDVISPIAGVAAPPYAPGQTWFYKIKFDEPYLMYRQWRELTRAMVSNKKRWEEAIEELEHLKASRENNAVVDEDAESGGNDANEGTTKSQQRRERKMLYTAITRKGFSVDQNGVAPPDPPKVKDNRPESIVYVAWCNERMFGNKEKGIEPLPELFERFNQGHGIIALREKFLEYLGSPAGAEHLNSVKRDNTTHDLRDDQRPFEKTLIVPIAVPGSGKTALAVALANLFKDWVHVQSDDVQTKRTGPAFLRNVETALRNNQVVIADRNNHLSKHRDEFVDIVRRVSGRQKNGELGPRVRLIALVWRVDELPPAEAHDLLAQRIIGRGQRHQCIRVKDNEPFAYDMIIRRFMNEIAPFNAGSGPPGVGGANVQPTADEQFTECVSFSLTSSLDTNIATAVDALVRIIGAERPSDEALAAALEAARTYSPKVRKPVPPAPSGDPLEVRNTSYIGVFIPDNVGQLASELIEGLDPSARVVLDKIKAAHRIVSNPHVTLIHAKDIDAHKDRWVLYYEVAKNKPTCSLQVTGIAWSDVVMSLQVESLHSDAVDIEAQQGSGFFAHITVGVTSANVKHYEGRMILSALAKDTPPGIHYSRVSLRPLIGNIEFCSNLA